MTLWVAVMPPQHGRPTNAEIAAAARLMRYLKGANMTDESTDEPGPLGLEIAEVAGVTLEVDGMGDDDPVETEGGEQ